LTQVARSIFDDELLPVDSMTLDTDGVEECYAKFHKKLREMEDEIVDKEIEAESDEETPPTISEDEYEE
jgi:hypothetical protein